MQFAADRGTTASGWHMTIAEVFAERERFAGRATDRSTPTRDFFVIPATVRRLEVSSIAIYRVEGGAIAER